MIKRCMYGEEEFEIEFEWPLSEEVVEETEQIRSFIDKVSSLPGTVILKEKNDITGLLFTYESFYELLKPFSSACRDVPLVDEFKHFFSEVK